MRRDRWRRPTPGPDRVNDVVFYRASDGAILGTFRTRKELVEMAKFEGTGKDPLGRYPKGIIYDISRADTATFEDHLARGWGRLIEPEEHPGRTVTQIANSMVRGDELKEPVEVKVAQEIGERAHAIVHTGDEKAKAAEAHPEIVADENNAPATGRVAHDDVTHWDAEGGFDSEPSAEKAAAKKGKKD